MDFGQLIETIGVKGQWIWFVVVPHQTHVEIVPFLWNRVDNNRTGFRISFWKSHNVLDRVFSHQRIVCSYFDKSYWFLSRIQNFRCKPEIVGWCWDGFCIFSSRTNIPWWRLWNEMSALIVMPYFIFKCYCSHFNDNKPQTRQPD
jgi:hypothetical protein